MVSTWVTKWAKSPVHLFLSIFIQKFCYHSAEMWKCIIVLIAEFVLVLQDTHVLIKMVTYFKKIGLYYGAVIHPLITCGSVRMLTNTHTKPHVN